MFSHDTTPHELWKVMFLPRPLQYLQWHKTSVLSKHISHLNMNGKSPPLSHKFQKLNSPSVVSFCRFAKAQVVTNSWTRDFMKVGFLFARSRTANTLENLCSGNLQLVWIWRRERVNIWKRLDETDGASDGQVSISWVYWKLILQVVLGKLTLRLACFPLYSNAENAWVLKLTVWVKRFVFYNTILVLCVFRGLKFYKSWSAFWLLSLLS